MSDRRSSGSGFEVDLGGVHDFGTRLRDDLDHELRPEGDDISSTFKGGVCFGLRSGSKAVQAAAMQYHAQLDQMVNLTSVFQHNTDVMAQAAADVVNAYRHADTMSGADLQRVLSDATAKVNAATAQADQARLGAEKAAAAAEDEFMRHHGGRR